MSKNPVHSMTGSGQVVQNTALAALSINLTTINSRYLEFYMRLPDNLRHLDPKLRTMAQEKLSRGKLDCFIQLNLNAGVAVSLNEDAANALMDAAERILKRFPAAKAPDAATLLSFPGVLSPDHAAQDELDKLILDSFDQALDKVNESRQAEGQRLSLAILDKLDKIEAQLDSIAPQLEQLVSLERERLTERLKTFAPETEIDPKRLEQEVVLAAQRSDIGEEYDRLRAHVAEVRNILKQGGVVGKRLDFMMQELNREANTMASKASSLNITKTAVELKVLIEQMREQVQNLQ